MSSTSAYTLPPINAGDVFTCQGNGLLYEELPRIPIEELRALLADGSGQALAGNRKESKKWFQAQCAHYGLPTKGVVANLRTQLDTFLASPTAHLPQTLAQLEVEKNEEYKALNEHIKSMTSRARSPTPGRARRVTMSNVPGPDPALSQAPHSGDQTPRSRTKSLAAQPQTHTKGIEPDSEPQAPVKRGRGRPRKSEPAPQAQKQTGQKDEQPRQINLASSSSKRPEPPSQTDSAVSVYSELDDEVMEVLDEIENGIDLLETDADGDSQMNPLDPHPSSPPPTRSPPAPPQTPRRSHDNSVMSPSKNSPKSTLERDVVSGMWSLRIVGYTTLHATSAKIGQLANARTGNGGTMNLHLAEDKRSLQGEVSLLGMDGVVQSKTLEGRIDGAYARLLFVGQMATENGKGKEGEVTNRVLGPSASQSGYLRFSDGRKGIDGRFTLKGALHGEGYGKVDFEGVRVGDEQDLCARWDDFVD
ncbi:hypothetical protein FRC09_007660 [Ceratobasidium sp. 395]|nr:hypothetical protein FRC09_007660 [Ceratobasidium sp. 395]